MQKINIVIVGGGFAGVTAARRLAGQNSDTQITLIDKHPYFLFHPNLYEAASSEEELVSVNDLRDTLGVPFGKLLPKSVTVIAEAVQHIDLEKKCIQLLSRQIFFDQLIYATGSVTDYFGIAGAEEFSTPLKSFEDTLRIRNKIEFAIQAARGDVKKRMLRIVVAGGGYTGIEFAAELPSLVRHVAWKNQYPLEKIEVVVVEAQNMLVPGFDERLSQDCFARLQALGVRIMLQACIAKVESAMIEFTDGEKLAFDVLVWTTGVRAAPLLITQELELDRKGRIVVDEYLRVKPYPYVFALGDSACVMDNGNPSPPTAQDAIHQAEYVSRVLPSLLRNQKTQTYKALKRSVIILLGGKYALLKSDPWYLTGMVAYYIKQIVHMRFYAPFLGWWKAFLYVGKQIEVFGRTDH